MRVCTTRPALLRLTRIHEGIGSGCFPSAPRLADEIEVSPRTIQRDIEFMRDQLGMQIEYDAVKHGYFYPRDGYELPAPRLREGELVALLVGTKVLEQYAGTPFEADLRRAFGRMAVMLPDEVAVHMGELADATAFRVTAPMPAELALFGKLTSAAQRRKRLRIVYASLSSGRTTRRKVDPYRMVCVDGAWYLVAHCHRRGEVRLFVPDRMREVAEMGEGFRAPKDFDLAEYMKGSFKVMRGGRPRRVRLRFTGMAATYVPERKWHSTQSVKAHGKTVDLEMTVTRLDEVAAWVMSFGGDCEVLAPEELRRKVVGGLRAGSRRNLGRKKPPRE